MGIRPGRAVHSVGLLRELIFPCAAACSATAKSCHEAADAEALSCVSAACAVEISAAQTACADDRRSDACREAVGDLRECADSCLDTRATALAACREAFRDCIDACDSEQ
jgi:hypothetical protein